MSGDRVLKIDYGAGQSVESRAQLSRRCSQQRGGQCVCDCVMFRRPSIVMSGWLRERHTSFSTVSVMFTSVTWLIYMCDLTTVSQLSLITALPIGKIQSWLKRTTEPGQWSFDIRPQRLGLYVLSFSRPVRKWLRREVRERSCAQNISPGVREGRERLEEKETEQDDDTSSSNTLKWFISLKKSSQVSHVMYLSVWLSQGNGLWVHCCLNSCDSIWFIPQVLY